MNWKAIVEKNIILSFPFCMSKLANVAWWVLLATSGLAWQILTPLAVAGMIWWVNAQDTVNNSMHDHTLCAAWPINQDILDTFLNTLETRNSCDRDTLILTIYERSSINMNRTFKDSLLYRLNQFSMMDLTLTNGKPLKIKGQIVKMPANVCDILNKVGVVHGNLWAPELGGEITKALLNISSTLFSRTEQQIIREYMITQEAKINSDIRVVFTDNKKIRGPPNGSILWSTSVLAFATDDNALRVMIRRYFLNTWHEVLHNIWMLHTQKKENITYPWSSIIEYRVDEITLPTIDRMSQPWKQWITDWLWRKAFVDLTPDFVQWSPATSPRYFNPDGSIRSTQEALTKGWTIKAFLAKNTKVCDQLTSTLSPEQNHFEVYPNPTQEILTIELPERATQSDSEIQIYDQFWRKLITKKASNEHWGNIMTMNLEWLPRWNYSIFVTNGKQKQRKKIVKTGQ